MNPTSEDDEELERFCRSLSVLPPGPSTPIQKDNAYWKRFKEAAFTLKGMESSGLPFVAKGIVCRTNQDGEYQLYSPRTGWIHFDKKDLMNNDQQPTVLADFVLREDRSLAALEYRPFHEDDDESVDSVGDSKFECRGYGIITPGDINRESSLKIWNDYIGLFGCMHRSTKLLVDKNREFRPCLQIVGFHANYDTETKRWMAKNVVELKNRLLSPGKYPKGCYIADDLVPLPPEKQGKSGHLLLKSRKILKPDVIVEVPENHVFHSKEGGPDDSEYAALIVDLWYGDADFELRPRCYYGLAAIPVEHLKFSRRIYPPPFTKTREPIDVVSAPFSHLNRLYEHYRITEYFG